MKTLDEVIKRLEDDIHAADEDSQLIMLFDRDVVDALHYLKEYRNKEMFYNQSVDHMVLMMNEHEDRVAMYLAEMHKNNPLTWSELKQMEGKPVWVEMNKPDDIKAWFLICQIDDSFVWVADGKGESHNFPRVCLDTGLWQAYRKERA